MISRRTALCGAALAAGLYGVRALAEAAWPSKPIRIIAAQAPGSSNDATARALADWFSQQLGVPVIVENRAGGVSMIAATAVAKANPDGYTLLISLNSQLAQAPVMLRKMPIDVDKDLVPIASLGVGPITVTANKNFPVRSFEELIAYAKQKPVNAGNYAIGSGWQIMLTEIIKSTGAEFNIVNYKGSGPMLVDLYSGSVDIGAASLTSLGGAIAQGTVRPLLVFTRKRSPRLPAVPTWAEVGFTGPAFQDLEETNVLFAPAGTPASILERVAELVAQSFTQSSRMKSVNELMAEDQPPLTGAAARKFIERTWPIYRQLTKGLGLGEP
jgi:tripartite-type tricarboxylate transporter receptor subunit TctC